MKKMIISVSLIAALLFSNCIVAFAATDNIIKPQANMVTYRTLSPLVGSASDYTIYDSTNSGNTVFDNALSGLTVTTICAGLAKLSWISALVANTAKFTSFGSAILSVAQAKNINEKQIYYTVTVYKYKSNGPNTYAFKYITAFTNQAKTTTYSTNIEYYTYVI